MMKNNSNVYIELRSIIIRNVCVLWYFIVSILLVAASKDAIGATNFLKMPLSGYVHSNAPISSFFDQSSSYHSIKLFNGEVASSNCVGSTKAYCYFSDGREFDYNYYGLATSRVDKSRIHYDGHKGIDYFVGVGTPVKSAADGLVVTAGWDPSGGGNIIKLYHSNKYATYYMHMSVISVVAGETVVQGQIIGETGNSGPTNTPPHLHFEVRSDCDSSTYECPKSNKVDPFGYEGSLVLWSDWSYPGSIAVPSVTTNNATNISSTSATLNATITNDGGASILERRFDWGTNGNRTDYTASVQVSGNTFSYNLTSLTPNTTYVFGSWVRNSAGWGEGNVVSFTTTGGSSSPDLVVQSPSVSASSLTPGQSFTVSATVRNQGNGSSVSTTLRYYRSTNSTITTSDTEIGTDYVSSLSASATSPESGSVSAPSSSGTYWIGACVDGVSGESNTSNNCSSGVQITVTNPTTYPDLVVESPAVSSDSLSLGQSFIVSAVVRNQGNGSAASTTLRYYYSTDATITTSDTAMSTDPVSALLPGATSPESDTETAPGTAGTYWIGACVDSVSGESNTGNNCSSGVQIIVAGTAGDSYEPDNNSTQATVIANGSSQDNHSILPSDDEDWIEFTIAQQSEIVVQTSGNGGNDDTVIYLYDSGLSLLQENDDGDGIGLYSKIRTSLSPGTYYVKVTDLGRNDEIAHYSISYTSTPVTTTAPDLVVETPSVSTNTLMPGQSFTVSVSARNQGNESASGTVLRYYYSSDSEISPPDIQMGTDPVAALAPGESSSESDVVTAPSIAGAYWVGACVDSVSGESNTGNNCSSGIQITVLEPVVPCSGVDVNVVGEVFYPGDHECIGESSIYAALTEIRDQAHVSFVAPKISLEEGFSVQVGGTLSIRGSLPALNDTGITWGGDYPDGNNITCSSNIAAPQDCNQGRDATHNDDSDGYAGFSFTKLDANGTPLPASAAVWFCVKDNVTGLIWEVKTDDGGIHDKDNTYRWGGVTAQGSGYGTYYNDWDALVNGSNNERLCGCSSWGVPTLVELESIVKYGHAAPAIDTNYFPNTDSSNYWSSSPLARQSDQAWSMDFSLTYSSGSLSSRNRLGGVRLICNR